LGISKAERYGDRMKQTRGEGRSHRGTRFALLLRARVMVSAAGS